MIQINHRQQLFNALLAYFFVAYGYLSINMGLPAYPTLARVFVVDSAKMRISMTVFLLGYALSQVCWGLLSDQYGRRRVVIWGSLIAIVGSLLSALAFAYWQFVLGRFIEALGTGFATVLTRAMLSDLFLGKMLKFKMTYVVIIAAMMPAISPIIGGHLLALFSWRAIYIGLAVMGGVIFLLSLFGQQESLEIPDHHISLRRVGIAMDYLARNKLFLGYLLPYGFLMGGLITFYAIAPFIYVTQLQVLPQVYGYLLLIVGSGYVLGAVIARFLSHYQSSNQTIISGLLFNVIMLLVIFVAWLLSAMTVWTVTVVMLLYAFSCGLVSPTTNAAALGCLDKHLGLASALMPSVVMGLSAAATAVLSGVSYQSLLPLLLMLLMVFVISLALFIGLVQPWRQSV